MKKIIKYVVIDILRNRIVLAYTLLLLVISLSIFNLEDSSSKGMLSLLNIILIIVPLVSIIFSTIYIYNAAEFIELLVSQPLKRSRLWLGLYSGLAISLLIAFLVGAGLPLLLYERSSTALVLLITGAILTIIFIALALLASVHSTDKAKGIGISILLWFFFAIIYDSIILFLIIQFSDYPLEKASIVFSSLNPVDLGRILILLQMDVSALMGYTGAVLKEFFGGSGGMIYSAIVMMLWAVLPLWWSVRKFNNKDL